MAGVRKKDPHYLQGSSELSEGPAQEDARSGQSLSCANLAKGTVCMCLAQKASSMVLNCALSTLLKR